MYSDVSASEDIDYQKNFKIVTAKISNLLLMNGVSVKAFRNDELPYFSNLRVDHQKIIVSVLESQFEIYSASYSAGISLRDTAQLSWQAIRRLGYVPSYDFFDKIQKDDFLEIYTLDSIQVFRDINFYRICSYSIEDLVTRPLIDLVDRPAEITEKIYYWVGKVMVGEVTATIDPQIPLHTVRELDSEFKIRTELKIKWYSPMFDNNKRVVALAVIAEAAQVSH